MTKEKRQQQPFTHWNQKLNLEYHFFLILNYKDFKYGSKKANKLYKEMSNFLLVKTSAQCRTHHQKKIGGLKREVDILYSFYQDYYQVRYLEIDHLVLQIRSCLKTKIDENIISKQKANLLEDGLQDTLKQLDFKNTLVEQTPLNPIVKKTEMKNQEVQFSSYMMENDINNFFNLDSQIERSGPTYMFDDQANEISSRFQ